MYKEVPIELILAVQQFVTCYGQVSECLSYSGYENDGTAYIEMYAKLPMSAYPRVRIAVTSEEVTVFVRVMTSTTALIDGLATDFNYFISLTNRIFSPEEFIKANRDFWYEKGKLDLFQ